MQINRNYGIDLLRILSTLLVVTLHVLKHGGIIEGLGYISISYIFVWGLNLCAECAVDCYGLISGYVGYTSKHKLKSIVNLWFTVLFYSLGIYLVLICLGYQQFSVDKMIDFIFPIFTGQYWYFTAYFILFFFSEGLNKVVEYLPKTKMKILLIVLFISFSIVPTVFNKDIFWTLNGNGVLWLISLYLFGAYYRKYGLSWLKGFKAIAVYLSMVLCGGLIRSVLAVLALNNHDYFTMGLQWRNYTSPLIFVSAIALLAYFINVEIKENKRMLKIITAISSASFGIYLIHDHPLIRELFMNRAFKYYTQFSIIKMAMWIIFTIIVIYLGCLIVDILRNKIFNLLAVDKLATRIDEKVMNVLEK